MSDVCREFGISRKTGYKLLNRYREEGPVALCDRSRRPGRRSRRMSLGPSTVLTCEQARTRAIGIIAAARNGEDPAAERDAGRKAITVKELAERFDRLCLGSGGNSLAAFSEQLDLGPIRPRGQG